MITAAEPESPAALGGVMSSLKACVRDELIKLQGIVMGLGVAVVSAWVKRKMPSVGARLEAGLKIAALKANTPPTDGK